MIPIRGLAFAGLVLALLPTPSAFGEVWPQFRGPRGDGVSREKNLPTRWSKDGGVLWATELPGRANSSPAVTAGRVDLTTREPDDSLWVISIDRSTGRILNKVRVGSGSLAATGPENLWAHRHNGSRCPLRGQRYDYRPCGQPGGAVQG